MQLIGTENIEAKPDVLDPRVVELLQNPPEGIEILAGSFGLGASWPALVWKSTNAFALALAVFAAPSTIEENWPRWQRIFLQVKDRMLALHGAYQVDRDTAKLIAMKEAVTGARLEADSLEVHMAVRHYQTGIAGYEDLLRTERVDMRWPTLAEPGSLDYSAAIRSQEEASRQATSRYIFGINDCNKSFTLVINSDGCVSYSSKLFGTV